MTLGLARLHVFDVEAIGRGADLALFVLIDPALPIDLFSNAVKSARGDVGEMVSPSFSSSEGELQATMQDARRNAKRWRAI
eukprot:2113616-Pleurochrysis_carterae.AAC.2